MIIVFNLIVDMLYAVDRPEDPAQLMALLEVATCGPASAPTTASSRPSTASASRSSAGKTLGIVGESGCGKSVTCLTIMGLNNPRNTIIERRGALQGREPARDAEAGQLRELRGNEIAMIFQDPMTSLNPVKTIGWQLIEAVLLHHDVSKKEARAAGARARSKAVGIPRAERRIDDYPHQFSGGMRQRVMIAMALINDPDLLIADEPTTALDVTTQAQILELMRQLQEELGTAIIMITHDLGVVAEIADDVVVMYAGRVVEEGAGRRDLHAPAPPVHVGPARLAPAARRRGRAARPDPGPAAVAAQPADRAAASTRAART